MSNYLPTHTHTHTKQIIVYGMPSANVLISDRTVIYVYLTHPKLNFASRSTHTIIYFDKLKWYTHILWGNFSNKFPKSQTIRLLQLLLLLYKYTRWHTQLEKATQLHHVSPLLSQRITYHSYMCLVFCWKRTLSCSNNLFFLKKKGMTNQDK